MVKNSKKRFVVRFKNKHRRSKSPQDTEGGGEDVMNSARQKLRGALQELMPHSDDDSSSEDESRQHWNSAIKRARREVGGTISGRRQGVGADKSGGGGEGFRNSFIMKLFDRTVDLSNYTESTPLYPICRAWIANSSLYSFNRKLDELKDDVKNSCDDNEIYSTDHKNGITRLPPPSYHLDDGQKLRVPKPVPYDSSFPNILQGDDSLPSREELLSDNLAHWTKVRQSWKEASRLNEQRYSCSIHILTNMFNKYVPAKKLQKKEYFF